MSRYVAKNVQQYWSQRKGICLLIYFYPFWACNREWSVLVSALYRKEWIKTSKYELLSWQWQKVGFDNIYNILITSPAQTYLSMVRILHQLRLYRTARAVWTNNLLSAFLWLQLKIWRCCRTVLHLFEDLARQPWQEVFLYHIRSTVSKTTLCLSAITAFFIQNPCKDYLIVKDALPRCELHFMITTLFLL